MLVVSNAFIVGQLPWDKGGATVLKVGGHFCERWGDVFASEVSKKFFFTPHVVPRWGSAKKGVRGVKKLFFFNFSVQKFLKSQ